MEKFKWLISALLGVVATFTDQYGIMIVLVIVAILFDVVTGIIKAHINGNVNSKSGTIGFFKKIALLVCLFFGFFLDYMIPYMCSQVAIEIPFKTPFGLIMCFYICLNEAISVCENLYACDSAIMPKWIVKALLSAKDKLDQEEDDNEDVE